MLRIRLVRWLLGYKPMPQPPNGSYVLIVEGGVVVTFPVESLDLKIEHDLSSRVFGDVSPAYTPGRQHHGTFSGRLR